MFLPLTTNLNRKWIKIWNDNLIEWKLDKKSIILIPKFWIVHKDLIIKELARVNIETLAMVWELICKEFWCDILNS